VFKRAYNILGPQALHSPNGCTCTTGRSPGSCPSSCPADFNRHLHPDPGPKELLLQVATYVPLPTSKPANCSQGGLALCPRVLIQETTAKAAAVAAAAAENRRRRQRHAQQQ